MFELGAQLSGTELRDVDRGADGAAHPEAVAKVRAALAAIDGASRKAKNGGVS